MTKASTIDYTAWIAKIDACLKPGATDLHNARQLGASAQHPEAFIAEVVWRAARGGVARRYLVSSIEDAAVQAGIPIDEIDFDRTEAKIRLMDDRTAHLRAEAVRDGAFGHISDDWIVRRDAA